MSRVGRYVVRSVGQSDSRYFEGKLKVLLFLVAFCAKICGVAIMVVGDQNKATLKWCVRFGRQLEYPSVELISATRNQIVLQGFGWTRGPGCLLKVTLQPWPRTL